MPVAAAGADLRTATEQDKATASEHYIQGMTAFEEGEPAQALEQFQLSYEAVESPNSHLMIGKALIDLGRYVEAHRELWQTIEQAEAAEAIDPKYAETKQAAEEELSRLEAQVVRLRVNVSGAAADAKVRINDHEYEPAELADPVVAAPGPLTVTLVEDGDTVAREELDGRAGDSLDVSLSSDKDAEPTVEAPAAVAAEKRPFPHRRETTYVAAGIGLGGALTFGAFGLLNHSKYSDVKDRCNDGLCSPEVRSDAERGHTYQSIANVGLIVGVVGIGTAVALILTEDDNETAAPRQTSLSLGPGRVSLRGTF